LTFLNKYAKIETEPVTQQQLFGGTIMNPILMLLLLVLLTFGLSFFFYQRNKKSEKFSAFIEAITGSTMFGCIMMIASMCFVGIVVLIAFLMDFLIHF